MQMQLLTYHDRRATNAVEIGRICIGGKYPIAVQTMANTSTNDVLNSVKQAKNAISSGAELLRFTTQGVKEVKNLQMIHQALHSELGDRVVPLVADVHFQATVAEEAAKVVEKVRINPGNYIDPARQFKIIEYTENQYQQELDRLKCRFNQLLAICESSKTALRIGVNHGSLSDRIMTRYGNSVEGMVESCMEFLRVACEAHFPNVVVSLKASNTRLMVEANRAMVAAMAREGMAFPLHLGVTEAGAGEDGRIKSAVGIGALLAEGIGDTLRISLSEPPENEIAPARELVRYFTNENSPRYTSVKWAVDDSTVYYVSDEICDWQTFQLHAAADCGRLLWENAARELKIVNVHFDEERLNTLCKDILQASCIKMYKTEYISCPSCGRTLFDLERVIAQVKAATAGYCGLKIAIMGCVVNGPGEMADADFGYVGAGVGRISLYKGKECVLKNIPQERAVEELVRLIEANKSI